MHDMLFKAHHSPFSADCTSARRWGGRSTILASLDRHGCRQHLTFHMTRRDTLQYASLSRFPAGLVLRLAAPTPPSFVSVSRRTAGAAGFLIMSQWSTRP